MKNDSKNALYIENVTEEYVASYDDVTQILIKVEKGSFKANIFENWMSKCYLYFMS